MRYMLTNPVWQELEPRVAAAKRSVAGAKPELPDRLFLEAVLYRARTGTPWRDLPEVFGDWNAVYQRNKRWRLAGVWERLFDTLPTGDGTAEVRRLFVDSTTVRAHPHAAGAKKKTRRPRTPSGGRGAGTRPRSTSPAPTRTPPSPSR
jgi:putative transposase